MISDSAAAASISANSNISLRMGNEDSCETVEHR